VVREGVKITESAKYVDACKIFSTDKKYRSKVLYNYADMSMSELKRVNGVGSGDILGTREYTMRIY
jgi:HAE1 family hydrophobic/amphiphilic exporter-1